MLCIFSFLNLILYFLPFISDCPVLQELFNNLTRFQKENSWLNKLLSNVTTESNSSEMMEGCRTCL